jgi:glycosyltransferase involved in cell wall biosynthesis
MKISIITVTFNSVQYLKNCIESVLNQEYRNLEYIIIDGKSTDGTVEIIENFGNRIEQFISEPDYGIYDAMNKGINLATSDVIGILNSDDVYQDTQVLSDVMACFENDPELDILYGNLVYVKSDDLNKVVRKWKSCPSYTNFFENGNVPPHPTLFVRSQVYQIAGLFDLEYKLAADYEFMLRIFKKHNFKSYYLNRSMVKMRLGGATNKNYKNIISGNKEILLSWKKNGLNIPFRLIPLKIIKRLNQFI